MARELMGDVLGWFFYTFFFVNPLIPIVIVMVIGLFACSVPLMIAVGYHKGNGKISIFRNRRSPASPKNGCLCS